MTLEFASIAIRYFLRNKNEKNAGFALLLEVFVRIFASLGKIIPRVLIFLEVYSFLLGFSGEDWKQLLMKEEYTDFIAPN